MKFFQRFAYYLVGLVIGLFSLLRLFSVVKIPAVIIFPMLVFEWFKNQAFYYSEKHLKF
jgi:hypothetical protein